MRRLILGAGLVFVSLAVAADEPPVAAPPPAASAATECGTAPEEQTQNPMEVSFCWSQAAADALSDDAPPKKSVTPPEAKAVEPKPSGGTKPPAPKGGKGTKL